MLACTSMWNAVKKQARVDDQGKREQVKAAFAGLSEMIDSGLVSCQEFRAMPMVRLCLLKNAWMILPIENFVV